MVGGRIIEDKGFRPFGGIVDFLNYDSFFFLSFEMQMPLAFHYILRPFQHIGDIDAPQNPWTFFLGKH